MRSAVIVVGAGIVGLATSRALIRRGVGPLLVLEAEPEIARHQTGHNSGVVHAGLYYAPGSRKAVHCRAGRAELLRFCEEHDVPVEVCGKVVVATRPAEIGRLRELERRGRANRLQGMRRLSRAELREREPHVDGLEALLVPETAIVDFRRVARALAASIAAAGGEIVVNARLTGIRNERSGLVVETSAGEFTAEHVVNCAGLHADRVARLSGARSDVRIVPFRGAYMKLRPERKPLIRDIVYPVPDPRLPFLGVHFTRTVGGEVEVGPTALLALKREGYRAGEIALADVAELVGFGGFWRMASRHWRAGCFELARAWLPGGFARSARTLVPELKSEDLVPHMCGVRAQAVDGHGRLLDDFCFLDGARSTHVLNAPSPAATASMSIGEEVASRVSARLTDATDTILAH